jgi:hypothetical protein
VKILKWGLRIILRDSLGPISSSTIRILGAFVFVSIVSPLVAGTITLEDIKQKGCQKMVLSL